jgi:hypothetical protein
MSCGVDYQFLWKDDNKYKKATVLPAPKYIGLTLDWCENLLNDQNQFPSDGEFPKNYKKIGIFFLL